MKVRYYKYPNGDRLRLGDRVRIGLHNPLHGRIVVIIDSGEAAEGYIVEGWGDAGGIMVETDEIGLVGYIDGVQFGCLCEFEKVS